MKPKSPRRRAEPPRVSVVIPCYNEAGGIDELHRRVSAACRDAVGESYEIVLVNDGSRDATRDELFALAARDPHIVAVDLARNYGQQIALTAGLGQSVGANILILDADLQDPPELLKPMLARMTDGYDVVYGQRTTRDGESRLKLATSASFYRVMERLSDVPIPRDTGDFRLMSRRVLDHLLSMPERSRFVRGMVSWVGFKQVAFPYERQSRFAGTTKYRYGRLLMLAIDALTSFSVVPLRFASHLGFGFGVVGLVMLVYTLVSWIFGYAVQGWTSLASIVLILGSAQLFVLGIFGEYLGRMYMETKRRPLYIVNEVVRGQQVLRHDAFGEHVG